ESTEGSCIQPVVEDKNRRKVIKSIVCGLTVFTAYNVLPNKWGTPIIEQVFLPAHAATSGVVLSGAFGGTGSIIVTSIGKRSPPNGIIAKVGTSIGDFFVSEAHAMEVQEDEPLEVNCCMQVEGETATYYLNFSWGDCILFSAPVDEVARYTDKDDDEFTAEIIEKGQDSVQVRLTRTNGPGFYLSSVSLTRSENTCECRAPVT
ncbi:MAG: hypothetical protein COA36_15815, partial [Desulfotalea sp.]